MGTPGVRGPRRVERKQNATASVAEGGLAHLKTISAADLRCPPQVVGHAAHGDTNESNYLLFHRDVVLAVGLLG